VTPKAVVAMTSLVYLEKVSFISSSTKSFALVLEVLDELLGAFLDQLVHDSHLVTGEGRTKSGPQVAPSLVATGEQIFVPEWISTGVGYLTMVDEMVEFLHRDLLDQVGVFDDQSRTQKLVHSVVPSMRINEREDMSMDTHLSPGNSL
jgi:hypothetical protein